MKFKNNNPRFKPDDDEDDDNKQSEMYLSFAKRTSVAHQISIHIDEPIKSAKYYRSVVQELGDLSENDEVIFRISSPGGDLNGLVALIEAIRNCDADILAVITGQAHSAASMLALSCPNVAITPSANMLVHFVSFGSGGKAQDVVSHVQHTVDYSTGIFRDVYQGFLTEEEMKNIIEGRELWLQAPEIEERLIKRQEFYQKLEEEDKPVDNLEEEAGKRSVSKYLTEMELLEDAELTVKPKRNPKQAAKG